MSGLKDARGKAARAFSDYIRFRDCLATTGTIGWGVCISCGRRVSFNEFQAGHLVPGRKNAILFDEDGCNGQCVWCNQFLEGNTDAYHDNLVDKIGDDRVRAVYERAKQVVKYHIHDYQETETIYKQKTKELFNGNSGTKGETGEDRTASL